MSVIAGGAPAIAGGSIIVTSTADAGPGSLRDAIDQANTNPGPDVITFDPSEFPSGGLTSIVVSSQLPTIDGAQGLTIDGSGSGVLIDGSDANLKGLHVNGSGDITNIVLRTIALTGFGNYTIHLETAGNISDVTLGDLVVTGGGNYGAYLDGGTSTSGVSVQSSNFSGNDNFGLYVSSSGATSDIAVLESTFDNNGNYGLYITGNDVDDVAITEVFARDNSNHGVHVRAGNNLTDTSLSMVTANGNAINGVNLRAEALLSGVTVDRLTSTGNAHHGLNVLATTITGISLTNSLLSDNARSGAIIDASALSDVTVSGNEFAHNLEEAVQLFTDLNITSATLANNTIADNKAGIVIFGFDGGSVGGVNITSNTITDSTGGAGVDITSDAPASTNLVADNTITGNSGDGIFVAILARAMISQNQISGNGELGIDLFDPPDTTPGVTPNDDGDGDNGPNDLLNQPVWQDASGYELAAGRACAGCQLEVFLSDGDPSGFGEGAEILYETTANTDGDFFVPLCDLSAGDLITATATDALDNTSEFSANYEVLADTPPCFPVNGDLDCDGDVDERDALIAFIHEAEATQLTREDGCPALGADVVHPASAPVGPTVFGDVNCSGAVDAQDGMAILIYVSDPAGAEAQGTVCARVGEPYPG